MNIDYRSIAIFLYLKGVSHRDIQYEIDSVFGPGSYSYSAITKATRGLSFPSPQVVHKKNEEKIVHQEKIEIIK